MVPHLNNKSPWHPQLLSGTFVQQTSFWKKTYTLKCIKFYSIFSHLPPYSGAMKCIFFMLSRHVFTWWWIASGATTERENEENKVRTCIQLCLRDCGFSRYPPPTSHICWPIPHTKTPVGYWRQFILPTFEKNSRPFPTAALCHRWHTATPHDRARPTFLCAR
jgi:hypothetical protein